jgi:hypothetical protein
MLAVRDAGACLLDGIEYVEERSEFRHFLQPSLISSTGRLYDHVKDLA